MSKAKLNDEIKTFIVQALACFDTPSEVAEAVKAEFAIDVSKQLVETHDPTKRCASGLAKRWVAIFEKTRADFLENTATIAISHRAYRLRALQRMAQKAEKMKNLQLARELLEQAAKEVGDAYTNKRQLTGAGGKPLIPASTVTVTGQMTAQEAAEAYQALINAGDE